MIYVFMYLAAIVAANLLVTWFGPAISIINALVFIGLDLSSRDYLHDAWHKRGLVWKMALLIGTGSALSYVLNRNAGPIAVASFAAFACAGVADALTYSLLGDRARLVRINGSNVVSAAVDSFAFLSLAAWLAWGWPPPWGTMALQFGAKILGGFAWSLVLGRRGRGGGRGGVSYVSHSVFPV